MEPEGSSAPQASRTSKHPKGLAQQGLQEGTIPPYVIHSAETAEDAGRDAGGNESDIVKYIFNLRYRTLNGQSMHALMHLVIVSARAIGIKSMPQVISSEKAIRHATDARYGSAT
eukprot:1160393-Pelagomonas_calceolata.AAC.5